MNVRIEPPNYKKVRELATRFNELDRADGLEAAEERERVKKELVAEACGKPTEVPGLNCRVLPFDPHYQGFRSKGTHQPDRHACDANVVYYPGYVHHLDGDSNNNSTGNLAMVCPKCHAHILMSRFTTQDISDLKRQGLNNAQVGKLVGLSRERVRQICKEHATADEPELDEEYIDRRVREAQAREKRWRYDPRIGKLPRLTDKRTVRKRVIAQLKKERQQQGKWEGKQ